MNIVKAENKDLKMVQNIVSQTIMSVYPNYYPTEVVLFFMNHHSDENIKTNLQKGNIFLLYMNGEAAGTGTMDENHIGRVFVLPQYQKKGCGSALMDFLENEIAKKYPIAILDASLPAYGLYLKRGYITTIYNKLVVSNNKVLCYHVMEKQLQVANGLCPTTITIETG